jgi:uncharacterized protein (TIGR04255 family)
MPFPDSQRVIFGKNPLEEVVCQLRFPPVLRVEADAAGLAVFQERVRHRFPLYRRTSSGMPMGMLVPPQILQIMAGAGASVAHEFVSADEIWKISLTREFLAVTTSRYADWSDFKTFLQPAFDALTEAFSPSFFQRVGLRYRDRIDRARIGLIDVPWPELLIPPVLGELSDAVVGPHIEHVARELIVELTEDAGRVRIVHGLQRENDALTYIIDSDFFLERQTETGEVPHVLEAFNRRAGRLFRWFITRRLHEAMEPRVG